MGDRVMTEMLSRRTLNRTLLHRQHVLARSMDAAAVVERLVAVQAQEANWPYVGLWSRLVEFRHEDLTSLLHGRQIVRTAAIRSTQHLVLAADLGWLRATVQPVLSRTGRSPYFTRETTGLSTVDLIAAGRELLGSGGLPRRELARRLGERFPGRNGRILAGALELELPLVHDPATAGWGRWGSGRPIGVSLASPGQGARADVERLIERYLAAFGPASVADIQAWSGLTRLREAVAGMSARLRAYRDERGTALVDLPDATIVDGDTMVPVRFLPGYDNILLAHADRGRLLDDQDRPAVFPGQARVRPTFLVDGFVRGTWAPTGSTVHLAPFRPLSTDEAAAVQREAAGLTTFLAQLPARSSATPRT